MRILLVSHVPLEIESGAAQIAINLCNGLRAIGHDAIAWSPEPLPPETRWWTRWRRRVRQIEAHVESDGPFDVIDSPAVTATAALAAAARLVVRSIQPELLYLQSDLRAHASQWSSPRSWLHRLHGAFVARRILRGWHHAHRIVALGTVELQWMRARFPSWEPKLGAYVCAPSTADRESFRRVRRQRQSSGVQDHGCRRLLWLGRWAAHKGLELLARLIAERRPGDRFTLAGTGTMTLAPVPPALIEAGVVRVIPHYRRDELPVLLAEHDAGLFTSTVEGWGLSLNEMLESGMPVFATEAGGVRDLQPYFRRSLRCIEEWTGALPGRESDLEDYDRRFEWTAIARAYETTTLRD